MIKENRKYAGKIPKRNIQPELSGVNRELTKRRLDC